MPEPLNGAALVRAVICSIDGGYNGLNPNQRLGITDRGGGAIDYTLTDQETGGVQTFTVTITPV